MGAARAIHFGATRDADRKAVSTGSVAAGAASSETCATAPLPSRDALIAQHLKAVFPHIYALMADEVDAGVQPDGYVRLVEDDTL